MSRFGSLATQYFDSAGDPLVDGYIDFYESGTTTRKNTYSDLSQTTANTNPVLLDADGRQPSIFFTGLAKAVLRDVDGVVIATLDPVGDTMSGAAFAPWSSIISYSIGQIVEAENDIYYRSITDDNLGNEPSASPSDWEIAIDYMLESQTVVDAGDLAVGNATTGLEGINTSVKGTIAVGNGTTTTTLAPGTDDYYLTPDASDPKGLIYKVLPGTANDVQLFPSSANWTKPAASRFVMVEEWAGGGGGACSTGAAAVGGGSGGEYICKLFKADDLTASVAVTIGAGGAGGVGGSPNNGSAGGDTSFGAYAVAKGGNPGITSSTVVASIPRASDATVAYGSSIPQCVVNSQAGYGGLGGGSAGGGNTIYGGAGGGGNSRAGGVSEFGGNGGAGTDVLNTAAAAGSVRGGGGGGSGNGGAGGAGGAGYARISTW